VNNDGIYMFYVSVLDIICLIGSLFFWWFNICTPFVPNYKHLLLFSHILRKVGRNLMCPFCVKIFPIISFVY
jgi:hypothetical protein